MKWTLLSLLLGCGCAWQQGALQPRGPKALAIAQLGSLFFWITFVVFLAVVGVAIWAFIRGARRGRGGTYAFWPQQTTERKLTNAVTASTLFSLVLLAVLLVASVATGRRLTDFAPPEPVRIKVTAHQWWWKIEYPGDQPEDQVVTANELHVPAGRAIELELTSADVIHSFWLPNLDGKHDLIPSHTVKTIFRVDRTGDYAGRCAEFCGYQHAHMDLLLVAETPTQFQAWLSGQRQPGREPRTDLERRGRQVLEQGPCAQCHTVSGTRALGGVGPDLSHFASRATLAAGASVRDRRSLESWITEPSSLKPGAQMPAVALPRGELEALVSYLESLK